MLNNMQVCEILLIINLLLLFIMYAVDCVIRTDRPSSVRNDFEIWGLLNSRVVAF